MLAEKIGELEQENIKLKELLKLQEENIPKPKQCRNCKHYVQHYGRSTNGVYFKIYKGHCTCGVPVGKRKGKIDPTPEGTCLCFQEKMHGIEN